MSHINVISKTQKIVVDPSGGSISVINAGPIGPTGLIGPTGPSLPRILGQTLGTATAWSNATATESDLTVSSGVAPALTLSLNTAKLYKAVFIGRFYSTVDGDLVNVTFSEGGVVRRLATARCSLTNAITIHHEWLFTPASAAAVIYKIRGARFSGTGTINGTASATTPFHFWIEDMG